MRQLLNGKYGAVFAHFLMWSLLGTFLLLWQPLTWRIEVPPVFWYKQAVLFMMLLALFYSNTFVFVPKFLNHNKIVLFIVVNILLALLVAFLIEKVARSIELREHMNRAFRAAREGGVMKRAEILDYFSLLIALIVLGMSTIMATVQAWQKNRRIHEELEREKIHSELSFLKAQINPHFFFNTLNNIYALTQINHEAAGEAIHKLSRMMRYVLYDTLQDKVMLTQEIAFIEDYYELMKLRLTENVKVRLAIPQPVRDMTIAPMLLLPFIENAFKHGTSTTKPSTISIVIRQHAGSLELEVRNTLFPEKEVTLETSNGIGLANTRRRLDLLYPNQYQLTVQENREDQEYYVHLNLYLA